MNQFRSDIFDTILLLNKRGVLANVRTIMFSYMSDGNFVLDTCYKTKDEWMEHNQKTVIEYIRDLENDGIIRSNSAGGDFQKFGFNTYIVNAPRDIVLKRLSNDKK
jgi:hypothetical protein